MSSFLNQLYITSLKLNEKTIITYFKTLQDYQYEVHITKFTPHYVIDDHNFISKITNMTHIKEKIGTQLSANPKKSAQKLSDLQRVICE